MTNMDLYKDPIIEKYIDLIKSKTNVFQEYYRGEPIRVPASNLPALIIAKTNTQVLPLTNVEDQHIIQMVITVITDIRADISDYNNIAVGTNTLYNLIEGRDENYALKSDSILGILRNNLEVDQNKNLRTDLKSITNAEYGMTLNKRTEQGWALESQVKFNAYFTQVRKNINP